VKTKNHRLFILAVILLLPLLVSGCVLGQGTTVYKTTTQVKTEPLIATVTHTVISTVPGQPSNPPVTVTHFITTTTTKTNTTTSPPPPASTVYLTTTVIQQGVSVIELILPAAEISSNTAFNFCIVVQNVSSQDMECKIPVIASQNEDEDYELTFYTEFFIQSGETKTVCTESISLAVGTYTIQAGEFTREFSVIPGSGG
jgi:hypothetical protein